MKLCCLIQIKWKKGKEAKLADFRQAFHTIHNNRPALFKILQQYALQKKVIDII